MFQSSRLRTLFRRNVCAPHRFFPPAAPENSAFPAPQKPFCPGAALSVRSCVQLYSTPFQPFWASHTGAAAGFQINFSIGPRFFFRLPTKNSHRNRISGGCFSLLFLYRRSCSSGREKCRRLKATYTPSWSLEEVTKSAAACTPGAALPMATPRPARRSIPASTSPSPQATA